ncbi:MAG TPA: PQQ-dependent dehydrogenase, methanol/ethanol family [Terriglobia bacterium]|jgi:alcohol dehydrogenase (cytochrome c)
MMKRILVLASAAALLAAVTFLAQGRGQGPQRQAPDPAVTNDQLLNTAKAPENWLMYGGSYMNQRYSLLNQITPANVKDLELKWVFQSRSLEKHEVTPLVVNGVMYTIQSPNDIVALDAVTGKTIWNYSHKPDKAAHNCCGNLTRGLAILGDKLFLAAYDARMIAIDAKTGKELWNTEAADPKQGYAFTVAPLVIKDKVIAGTAGGEFGVRGFIAAWDVNTGKEVWRFNTIPGPGEPGHETWSGDSWMHGGAPIWVTGSYDPDLNLTYWGTGNPGPDWDGDARLGDNLYSCSVIALNPDTGKLQWHYQFSPHNEFDWDSTQTPVLADIEWQGRNRKVMLWANRSGMYYVLDRISGEFMKGQPFVKTNWATGFDRAGRPIFAPGIVPTKQGTLVYPGNQGGTNWYPPSFSPRTGLFYIPAWENSSSTYVKGEAPPEFHDGQTFSGPFPKGGATGEDEYSAVRAIDPKTGEKKWDFRQPVRQTEAGILTTASDLLFSGARDGTFYALDARDGKLLWQTSLGPSVAAGPMSYSVNGKQYLTIMVGSSLFTFGLRQ